MKKQVILEAAARLFAERGFENTPTMLIAQEAGVAEGTIFRHFKTKDEIFLTLLHEVNAMFLQNLMLVASEGEKLNGLGAVQHFARSFCLSMQQNRIAFALLFRDAPNYFVGKGGEVHILVSSLYAAFSDYLERNLQRGQQDGSVIENIHVKAASTLMVCTLIGFLRGVHFKLANMELEPHIFLDAINFGISRWIGQQPLTLAQV